MAGWNLYIAGGWLIAAAGLALVLVCVFGRRVLVRRVPRCVVCGYRLDGAPADLSPPPCPECGRPPRTPAEPYALGRRRWIGLLGTVLLAAGLLLPTIPVVRAQGWPAAMPIGIQARLLPHSDDERLWTRVAVAAADGRLSEAAAGTLCAEILSRMTDASRDPTPALGAFDHVMHSRATAVAPLDRESLLRILAAGAPAARARAVRHVGGQAPPLGEEISLRRQAWRAASGNERRELLEWFVLHPADTEDLAIIRAAFEAEPWRTASNLGRIMRVASPVSHGLMLELLGHQDPRVREGAVMVFEDWLGERDDKPPREIQAALLRALTDDPHPGVVRMAHRSAEDLSEEFGPAIGEAIAATTEPDRLDSLLYVANRKDDPGVLAGLAAAAAQTDRPLWQRTLLMRAFLYVRARTDQTSDVPDFSDIYRATVVGLLERDAELLIRIGHQSDLPRRSGMILAVLDRAAAEGVTREQLGVWLADHPGLRTFILLGEPNTASPRDALAEFVRHRWTGEPTDSRFHAVTTDWFPELLPQDAD